MARIHIDESVCKGCGLCVAACPRKIIVLEEHRLNSKGYNPACVIDMDKCIGCAMCALTCPDVAIEVEK